MRPFFYLAIVGLCLSLIAHGVTFFGIDPQQSFPTIWLLHLGIFVVWLPAIFVSRRRNEGVSKPMQWDTLLAGTPRFLRASFGPLFAYTFFNFLFTIFFLLGGHSPRAENRTFVLKDHGKIVRTISESEYHRYRGYEVRGFSGHWIFFYFVGMMMLYPRAEERENLSVTETVRLN